MAEQSWIRIRKHLAEKIEHLVNEKLGGKNPQLIRYENEYFETLNRKWKIEDRRALLDRLMAVRLVYLGDFHALRQSQKAHLRILRSVLGKKEIVIGLECFASKDQKWIDLHLGGKLSEESLLKKTKWDQNWGFPWENYRVVMQFAKQHRLPVYGLNSPVESVQSLQKRDRHAAQVILKMRKQHPRATLFVVFGDLHLADAHLPKKVTKVAKSKRENFVRIFQNSEKLYYRLAKKHLDGKVDLMRTGENDFCILNTAPWVKWQNYLMYLEQNVDFIDDFDDDFEFEYTDHVARWVGLLASELGFKIPTGDLAVYSLHDENLFEILERAYSKRELIVILDRIKRGESFFLPEQQIAVLAEPSVNHAAHLAAEFVHYQKQKSRARTRKIDVSEEAQFLRAIWVEALAYFGTKLVNPNRKSNTLKDLQKELLDPHPEFSREALVIALGQKFYEQSLRHGNKIKKRKIKARHKSSRQIASRLLGAMLGEKIYNGYRLGKVTKNRVRKWYTTSLETKDFNRVYYKEVIYIDSLPTFFESKLERL